MSTNPFWLFLKFFKFSELSLSLHKVFRHFSRSSLPTPAVVYGRRLGGGGVFSFDRPANSALVEAFSARVHDYHFNFLYAFPAYCIQDFSLHSLTAQICQLHLLNGASPIDLAYRDRQTAIYAHILVLFNSSFNRTLRAGFLL